MSAKPCDNCTIIMVNYADLWLIHSHVDSLIDGARLELRELKPCSTLLGACTTCPLLRYDLEALVIEIKDLKHKLNHSSRYTILSPPWETFSPVAHLEAIRILLAFAASKGFKLYQMDIKSAFLNGVIQEEVFVRQPPGFENPKYPNRVYKLSKTLYRLKHAPRA
jgi:hypothetical protein